MDRKKRNKQITKPTETVVNHALDRIPHALLQLQDRGFLAPKRESLEVDSLFESLVKEEEAREENGNVYNNQHYTNVFERHEQRLANALPGLMKNYSSKESSAITQKFSNTNHLDYGKDEVSGWKGNVYTEDLKGLGNASKEEVKPFPNTSNLQGPQKLLSMLSIDKGKSLGKQSTLNFQVPDFHRNSTKQAPKIEIGKLIEQVNIHAQDVSGGSQQLVKVLKEKLVEILKNELKTTY